MGIVPKVALNAYTSVKASVRLLMWKAGLGTTPPKESTSLIEKKWKNIQIQKLACGETFGFLWFSPKSGAGAQVPNETALQPASAVQMPTTTSKLGPLRASQGTLRKTS